MVVQTRSMMNTNNHTNNMTGLSVETRSMVRRRLAMEAKKPALFVNTNLGELDEMIQRPPPVPRARDRFRGTLTISPGGKDESPYEPDAFELCLVMTLLGIITPLWTYTLMQMFAGKY